MKRYLLDCRRSSNNSHEFCFDKASSLSVWTNNLNYKLSATGRIFALLICSTIVFGISGCKSTTQSNTTETATDQHNSKTDSSAVNNSKSNSFAQNSSAANLSDEARSATTSSACRLSEADSLAIRHIKFETSRYDINLETAAILQDLASRLKQLPANCKVEIGNHTDNIGKPAANQALSDNRATAVKDYLIKLGVSTDQLSAYGYADTRPAAPNSTEEGRAINRRTEFKLIEEK